MKTGVVYGAGRLQLHTISSLIHSVCEQYNIKCKKKDDEIEMLQHGFSELKNVHSLEYVKLEIITRHEVCSNIKPVDVGYLQGLPENSNAVFQVASNFNGIEAISEMVHPEIENFTERYYLDRTQGPAASISAGAAAIIRVHAPFYDSKLNPEVWDQTRRQQLNFLSKLSSHFPQQNGYIAFTGDEPKFPKPYSKEYYKMLLDVFMCYHQECQVITGHKDNGGKLYKVHNPDQKVDQVFSAAVNICQGKLAKTNANAPNSETKCRFVLESAYNGAYLEAISNKRSKLFLTLIGGGSFGNRKEWILDAILSAHKKWAVKNLTTLEKVVLVAFKNSDIPTEFLDKLIYENIPHAYTSFLE